MAAKPCAFFINELKTIYQSKQQSLQALAKMAELAVSDRLSDLMNARISIAQQHLQRLEQVFNLLETPPQAKQSEGMEGLIAEMNTVLNESTGSPQFDAALVASAQKMIHYKIASYGCLCSWSYAMNLQPVLEHLKANSNENKAFDIALTQIAQSEINVDAFSLAP